MRPAKKHLATALVGVVALILALVFTRDMASSFDSVRYANVAHWIAAGDGITTSLTVVPVQEGLPAVGDGLYAFTIQPPGLPLFYALTGVANRARNHAILHLVSLLVLAWLVLQLGRQLTGRPAVGATAALLTILSPALLLTVENLWTDLPTVTLLLGALHLVIRSRAPGAHGWRWLPAASVLGALAVSLRLTALAFGAVLVMDILLNRRLAWRTQLLRLVSGAGLFGGVTIGLLLRNRMLSGSFSGTAPHDWPLAPAYSLGRGATHVGSRLLQSLAPGWAAEPVARKLTAANAGPGIWAVPAILLLILVGVALAVLGLRRAGRLAWPPAGDAVSGSWALVAALFAASLLVLVLPAGRHADFRVVELRYLVAVLPLLWLGITALLMSTGRGAVDLIPAMVLVLVFALGLPGLHRPYRHTHEYMRTGLDWLERTIPPTTPILSNGGKVLLDENLTRRVFHLSDWNFRHALGPRLRREAGLLQYLRDHGIGYVVLFGQPDMHKAEYWGKPIIELFLERRWAPWLAYRDQHIKVYRIPAAGPPPAQP